MEKQILDITNWLETQMKQTEFGTISVSLIMHEKKLKRYEKTVTIKNQPDVSK